MTAASGVCEEDLDTSRFILKQLDYSLSISMYDSWLVLPRQLTSSTITR